MSLGKGSLFSSSISQKLNTKSSTEAELVGMDDGMPLVVWTRNFMIEQGCNVKDNVVYIKTIRVQFFWDGTDMLRAGQHPILLHHRLCQEWQTTN